MKTEAKKLCFTSPADGLMNGACRLWSGRTGLRCVCLPPLCQNLSSSPGAVAAAEAPPPLTPPPPPPPPPGWAGMTSALEAESSPTWMLQDLKVLVLT